MKLLYCLQLLLLSNVLSAQFKSGWKDMELKGKVKSVKETRKYRNSAESEFKKINTKYYDFNNKGYYIKYAEFQPNDSIDYKITYTYNNEQKTSTEIYYNENGKPGNKWVFKYNNLNQMIERARYTSEGLPDGVDKYYYNAKGENVNEIHYTEEGKLYSNKINEYDSLGRLKNSKLETPGYANTYSTYAYNNIGHLIKEETLNHKKEIDFIFTRAYDEKGNKIEEKIFSRVTGKTGIYTWKYEFDKNGNWIKKTSYFNDKSEHEIKERKIIYY